MSVETVLTGFKPLQLSPPKSQAEVLDYFAWVITAFRCQAQKVQDRHEAQRLFEEVKAKVASFAVGPNYISARQLNALPQTLRGEGGPSLPLGMGFDDGPQGADLGAKMRQYQALAQEVFERAYEGEARAPSSLIHVTCAGYVSPSAAQTYVVKRGWETGVTHSYHMGCYGAFPPLKMANGFLAASALNPCGPAESQVDIVHTEFLSLHGDYSTLDPGTLVNMTLFADGFIKYSAVRRDALAGRAGFQVLSAHEVLIPGTEEEMTWVPSGHLFEMFLSKNVPLRIKQSVRPFVAELCRRAGLDFASRKDSLFFAIHPGGPKILDHIAEELGIRPEQMRWSREVLFELGNMSSATVPHIWARMLEALPTGSEVVSMAFGPGLTATGLVLRKV